MIVKIDVPAKLGTHKGLMPRVYSFVKEQ